jgi:hypothetical protein
MMLVLSGLSCMQTEITAKEKQLLFTFADMADYTVDEFQDIGQCETYQKVAVLNLMKQYTYTFTSTQSKRNRQFLYINSILQRYPSVIIARQNMLTQAGTFRMAFNVSLKAFGKGMHIKDDNRLFTRGDQNYHSYILTKDNRKIGNLVITRVGRSILQVVMMGQYFDERDLLDECMEETVANLRKH